MSSPAARNVATASVAYLASYAPKHCVASGFTNGASVDLNWLNRPAVGLTQDGAVLGMNAAMQHVLGDDIRIQNGRLRLSDPKARERLDTLIEALQAGQLTSDVEPLVIKRQEGTAVVMRVMIVPDAARGLFSGAGAILTFLPVGQRCRPAPQLVSQIFGLTPAEARLSCELAGGSDLTSAACTLNISWETARTQLKTVFLKTNTHRQGELVSLLSCLSWL